MRNHKNTNESMILLRNFIIYIKKVSVLSNKLQQYKRQLASLINSINYIIPYEILDMDKKGIISVKNIQQFLIQHKYYQSTNKIKFYIKQYSNNKQYLNYQDVLELLLPIYDYHVISSTIMCNGTTSRQCLGKKNNIIQNTIAFIINLEINDRFILHTFLQSLMINSQRIGAILWTLLDFHHNNTVTYEKIKFKAEQFDLKVQEYNWIHFLHWFHIGGRSYIQREQFMKIIAIHNQNKKIKKVHKLQQFIIIKQQQKAYQKQKQYQQRKQQMIKEKLMILKSTLNDEIKQWVKQEHLPYHKIGKKHRLEGKIGYSRPKNMIKSIIMK